MNKPEPDMTMHQYEIDILESESSSNCPAYQRVEVDWTAESPKLPAEVWTKPFLEVFRLIEAKHPHVPPKLSGLKRCLRCACAPRTKFDKALEYLRYLSAIPFESNEDTLPLLDAAVHFLTKRESRLDNINREQPVKYVTKGTGLKTELSKALEQPGCLFTLLFIVYCAHTAEDRLIRLIEQIQVRQPVPLLIFLTRANQLFLEYLQKLKIRGSIDSPIEDVFAMNFGWFAEWGELQVDPEWRWDNELWLQTFLRKYVVRLKEWSSDDPASKETLHSPKNQK